MVRFFVKIFFHIQQVIYFCEKYFLGVEISGEPPNLPQITKNQILTKFCSKMSKCQFFENDPKNKALHRKTIWSVFFVKIFFHIQQVIYFCEKYFLGVEISGEPPNLPQITKNQILTKFCSKMSKCWFFQNDPKNKALHRKTIWSVFLSKYFFTFNK